MPIKFMEKDTDVFRELSLGPCCGILFLLIYASIDSPRIVLWSLLLFSRWYLLLEHVWSRFSSVEHCSLKRSVLFSDMATGRRGSHLSEMSQSLAGLRLICSSLSFLFFSFFFFLCSVWRWTIGRFQFVSRVFVFITTVVRRFKATELSELGLLAYKSLWGLFLSLPEKWHFCSMHT